MAKVTVEWSNGKTCTYDVSDESDVLYRVVKADRPFAMKLWTVEDIQERFEDRYGREATEAEIDSILNEIWTDIFEDCTDAEWNAIDTAIDDAMKRA